MIHRPMTMTNQVDLSAHARNTHLYPSIHQMHQTTASAVVRPVNPPVLASFSCLDDQNNILPPGAQYLSIPLMLNIECHITYICTIPNLIPVVPFYSCPSGGFQIQGGTPSHA